MINWILSFFSRTSVQSEVMRIVNTRIDDAEKELDRFRDYQLAYLEAEIEKLHVKLNAEKDAEIKSLVDSVLKF